MKRCAFLTLLGIAMSVTGGARADIITLAGAGLNTSGLVRDDAGNLYGPTSFGGAYGEGPVFEAAAGSGPLITLATFDGANGSHPGYGKILYAAGNLYGATDTTEFEVTLPVTAVPEPGPLALGSAALLIGCAVWSRR